MKPEWVTTMLDRARGERHTMENAATILWVDRNKEKLTQSPLMLVYQVSGPNNII